MFFLTGAGLFAKPIVEGQAYAAGILYICMEGGSIGDIGGLVMCILRMEKIIERQPQAGFILPYVLLDGCVDVAHGAHQVLGGNEPAPVGHRQFSAPSFFKPELVEHIQGADHGSLVEVDRIDSAFVDELTYAAVEIEVPPFCRGQGQVGYEE